MRGFKGFGARAGAITLVLLGAAVVAPQVAQATVWQVNTTADTSSGCPSICSLRAALAAAGSGDTINVPAGQYTLSPALGGLSAAPSSSITIMGAGASSVTIDGNGGNFSVFSVPGGSQVTMSGVTVTGASFDGDGGGISVGGTLNLSDSTITGNAASNSGGGIFSTGTLAIANSTITSNKASGGGGGIDEEGGHADLVKTAITSNTAASEGGGIFIDNGTATVTGSTISANTVSSSTGGVGGGGIDNNGGSMTIARSTISANTASTSAGVSFGGGIDENSSSADAITNSTITGNTVPGSGDQGGGIFDNNNTGGLTGINDTISGNRSADGANVFYNDISVGGFQNTIIANPLGGGQNCDPSTVEPPSLGHNLVDDATGVCFSSTTTGDLLGKKPKLGSLAKNGGPTKTMALLPGSPAINAGATLDGVATDQRGYARPQPPGGAPDIGAYEFGALVDLGIQATAPQPATVGHTLIYTLRVANHGPTSDSAFGVQVVDTLPPGVKFVSATPSAGTCRLVKGKVTCSLGTIARGTTKTVAVAVLPQKPGFPVNNSSVSNGAQDPNLGNNQVGLKVTVQDKPDVLTKGTNPLAYRDATVHATVNPNNAKTTYYFEYGLTTSYGSKTGTRTASGLSSVGVALPVNGLDPGRLYHYRIVAVNAAGATKGGDHKFFTYFLPILHVSPSTVRPDQRLRVYGNAGECPVGETVTLLSNAFPNAHTYKGQGAIYTTVQFHGFFSTMTRVPSDRHRGTYPVSGLCGRFPAGGAGDVGARAGAAAEAERGRGGGLGPEAIWSARLRLS